MVWGDPDTCLQSDPVRYQMLSLVLISKMKFTLIFRLCNSSTNSAEVPEKKTDVKRNMLNIITTLDVLDFFED